MPDELRVFLLQMVYASSTHARDKRWDGPHRTKRLGKKQKEQKPQQPDASPPTVEGSDLASDQQEDEINDGDTEHKVRECLEAMVSKERSHRANMGRLHTSMDTSRFRQIAATWRVFDFCEPPQRSERRRRLKLLQAAVDALIDGGAVTTLPALLAVGARGVRCRNPPVAYRLVGYRCVDVTFVMDSKRYVHDVVITEARRRQRFRTIHPNAVDQIRNKLKPSPGKSMYQFMQEMDDVMTELVRRNCPDMIAKEPQKKKKTFRGMDSMIRYFYMDGLMVSDAERCVDKGIFCMAPISPDDPRCSEFATVDEDMPRVVSDNGRLTCVPYGDREKVNFFYSGDSRRRRHQLVSSAFHQLDGVSGCRALQQVKKTQRSVRKAVRQVTSRLSHGSTRNGLR